MRLREVRKHLPGKHSQKAHGVRHGSFSKVKASLRKLQDSPEELARYKKKVRKGIKKEKAQESTVWKDNMELAQHIKNEGYRKRVTDNYSIDSQEYYRHNKLAEAIENEETRAKKYPDYQTTSEIVVNAEAESERLVNQTMQELGIKGKYRHPTLERDRTKLAEQEKQRAEAIPKTRALIAQVENKTITQMKKDDGVEKGTFKVKMRKDNMDNVWEDVEVEGYTVGKLGVSTDKRSKYKNLDITHIDTGMSTGIPARGKQVDAVKTAVVMNALGNWDFGSTDYTSEETQRGMSKLGPTFGAARPFLFDLTEGKKNVRTEGIP